jgi:transcriptional antiterminator RfaH
MKLQFVFGPRHRYQAEETGLHMYCHYRLTPSFPVEKSGFSNPKIRDSLIAFSPNMIYNNGVKDLELGADDCLARPFGLSELLSRLRYCLRRCLSWEFAGSRIKMKHWYALYTKPQMEQRVSAVLQAKGMETYLPTIPVYKGRRRTEKSQTFFSCYLFARMDLGTVGYSSVAWTPGLRRIVSFGGQPAAVRDEVIETLRRRLERMEVSGYSVGQAFKSGDRVLIKSGPLRDLEAVFDKSLSSSDRAKILVDILGRLTACEIELDRLEKVTRKRSGYLAD